MQNSTRPNRPELDATRVPSEIDIAWAAGIYEGEGHCRLCGHTKRGFMVSVVQKDPELLYRLREWFGGSITTHTKRTMNVWNCCGDRARIFISLIYGFMTVRRKAQIDATGTLDFLGSVSPIGLSTAQLKSILADYYANHAKEVRERRRKAAADKYNRISSDPEWKKLDKQKKAVMRSNMTEAQKEEMSKYQHERYLKKKLKKQQTLHVVQIESAA